MTKAWRPIVTALCLGLLAEARLSAAPEGKGPINLSASLRADYTDNRDSTEANEESTFDVYVTPRIDAYADTERTSLEVFYAPSLRYRENPSDIQNDVELLHDLGLNGRMSLSELTKLRLLEKFSYQDDPSIAENGSQVRDNRSYFYNRIEFGVRQDLNPRTYGDVLGRYTIKRYKDDPVAAESDEDRVEGELTLWHQLTRSLAVHGLGGVSSYGYDSAIGVERDFDALLAAVGLEKIFSPKLRGGLDVGAQSVEYSDDTLDGEVFPYGRADVTVSPTPASRIRGTLGHGVRDSDVYPFASQEYTEFRGGVEVDTSAIVTVGADATYRVSDYNADVRPANAPATGGATEGDETTTVLAAFLNWKLRDTARLVLRQVYEDVDSDVSESFQKNTSSAELHVDF